MSWQAVAKQRMRELHLTQQDFIKPLGVSTRGAVGHYFTGRRTPTPEQFKIIAGMLKISMDNLIGGDGVEPGLEIAQARATPIVGQAMLGENGYFVGEDYPPGYGDGFIDHPTRDPNAYSLRVVGDSMSPAIRHGWFVTCEPNSQCQVGEFVHVLTKLGQHMVKELLYERIDEITLLSVNGEKRLSLRKDDLEYMHHVGGIYPPSKRRL